jgi:hypothetical protein
MNINIPNESTLNELESPEDAADRHFADWGSQEAENNSEKKEESK